MIFIMARNHQIADEVANYYGYQPGEWRYLTHRRQLLHFKGENSGCHIHETANYWDNKNHYNLIDDLNDRGIRQHHITSEMMKSPCRKPVL